MRRAIGMSTAKIEEAEWHHPEAENRQETQKAAESSRQPEHDPDHRMAGEMDRPAAEFDACMRSTAR